MAKSPYTELPEVLKDNLPQIFASYPGLCEATPSSWLVWSKIGKVSKWTGRACHADMRNDYNFDDLITSVPKSDEISLAYLRMIIKGPFRAYADLINIERYGSFYFIHCSELNKWPANVLMNFCIATRVPIEFDFLLSHWAKRCEKGFDPVLAFLLTYSYGSPYTTLYRPSHVLGETRTFKMARDSHMWLDPSSDWSNILSGTMTNESASYKTNPSKITPTNYIWGVKSGQSKKFMDMSDEEIAQELGLPAKVPEVFQPEKYKPKVKKMVNPYAQGQIDPANLIAQDNDPWPNIVVNPFGQQDE